MLGLLFEFKDETCLLTILLLMEDCALELFLLVPGHFPPGRNFRCYCATCFRQGRLLDMVPGAPAKPLSSTNT